MLVRWSCQGKTLIAFVHLTTNGFFSAEAAMLE